MATVPIVLPLWTRHTHTHTHAKHWSRGVKRRFWSVNESTSVGAHWKRQDATRTRGEAHSVFSEKELSLAVTLHVHVTLACNVYSLETYELMDKYMYLAGAEPHWQNVFPLKSLLNKDKKVGEKLVHKKEALVFHTSLREKLAFLAFLLFSSHLCH